MLFKLSGRCVLNPIFYNGECEGPRRGVCTFHRSLGTLINVTSFANGRAGVEEKVSAFFKKKVRVTRASGLLGWAQEDFADEGLRGLRGQHCDCVGHIRGLQHLGGIFSRVRAQFGVD
jgi:hypothetical protein